jgi:hypothetical protein
MTHTQFPSPASQLSVPNPRRRTRSRPVTLITVVGTAFLRLMEYLPVFPRAVILAVDVPEELATLKLRSDSHRFLFTVPIGQEQTVQSIVASFGTADQLTAIEQLPSAGSSEGMAQLRGIGGAAMRQLTKRQEFQRLLREQLIPLLTMQSGGEMPRLRYVHLQGTAGGMGSEGGIVLFDHVLDALLENCNAAIQSEVHLLGGLSFDGPDFPRVRENSAASVGQWLSKCRHPASDRVWISMFCSELLPVGRNKQQRDSLLLEQYQALFASTIASELSINRSNETLSGPFGSSRLVQSDHFRALAVSKVVADIARVYEPLVAAMVRTTGDIGRVQSFRWRSRTTELPRETVNGALDRALETAASELIDSITRRGVQIDFTPVVTLRDGRQLPLDNVRATFATPLSTVDQASERICLLRTCRVACRQMRSELLLRLGELERAILRMERKAIWAVFRLHGAWLFGLFFREETTVDKAFRVFTELQQAWDDRYEAEAMLQAVEASVAQLTPEIGELTGKLKGLSRILRRALPQGDARQQKPHVIPVPIDEMFSSLLDLVERRASYEAFEHLLAQGVKFVTPRGLAKIVGAADTSVEAIVRATVAGDAATRGPHWGGIVREDQNRQFLVFPPVEPDLARGIAEHHQGLADAFGKITFAETALGSVNVIVLEVTSCRVLDDIWVPYYQQGLDRALRSDLAPLFLSDASTRPLLTATLAPPDQHKLDDAANSASDARS